MINKKIFLFLFPLLFIFFSSISVHAKPVTDVTGSYGLIKCNYDVVNGYSSCAYVSSYSIIGDNTTYTMLDKATLFSTAGVTNTRYNVFNALYLFPNLNYKNGSFYTLNFEYNQGSYVSTIVNTLTKDNLVVEAFNGSDFESGGYTDLNFSATYNDTTKSGTISITFKATTDTTSYRIRLQPGVALWTNTSLQYAQGVRVYLISANVEDNLSDALLNQITNQNDTIIDQNQQLIDSTNKTNDKLDDLKNSQNQTNDYIKDESDVDTSEIDNLVGYLPPGPVDSIINLPLSMLNAMVSNLSKSCTSISINIPFVDYDFSLPCLNSLYDKMGATALLNTLGSILSAILLYKYLLNLYNYVDHVLSLKGDRLKGWGSE